MNTFYVGWFAMAYPALVTRLVRAKDAAKAVKDWSDDPGKLMKIVLYLT